MPEVIGARHAGIRVFGLSLITNKAVTDYDDHEVACHDEVLKVGLQRCEQMKSLILKMIEQISKS